MPQPFNYSLGLPDPTTSVLQAVQGGQAITHNDLANHIMQVQSQQQDVLAQDLSNLHADPSNTNLVKFMNMHPEMADRFAPMLKEMGASQSVAALTPFTTMDMALANNKIPLAQQTAQELADAHRAAGEEDVAKAIESAIPGMKTDPIAARVAIHGFLSASLGKDYPKYQEGLVSMTTTPQQVASATGKAQSDTAEGAAKTALVPATIAKGVAEAGSAQSNALVDAATVGSREQISQSSARSGAANAAVDEGTVNSRIGASVADSEIKKIDAGSRAVLNAANVEQAQANAIKAKAEAKNIDKKLQTDLEFQQQRIKDLRIKISQDTDPNSPRNKLLAAQIRNATTQADVAQNKMDTLNRKDTEDAQNFALNLAEIKDNLDEIKKNPTYKDGTLWGPTIGTDEHSSPEALAARSPSAADLDARMEQLRGQIFQLVLPSLKKIGRVSNVEALMTLKSKGIFTRKQSMAQMQKMVGLLDHDLDTKSKELKNSYNLNVDEYRMGAGGSGGTSPPASQFDINP